MLEEEAEEYAKLNARQYIHNDGIGFCTSEEEVKQAFLAGPKAGKDMNVPTKWHDLRKDPTDYVNELKLKFIEPKEKRIAELEEKISVLLSCKNCPENKDGLICQKEYENKCLAQKIQFIKELQQENAELKGQVETSYEIYNDNLDYSYHIEEQLTEAKKVIEELYNIIPASMSDYAKEPMEHARKFMTEE